MDGWKAGQGTQGPWSREDGEVDMGIAEYSMAWRGASWVNDDDVCVWGRIGWWGDMNVTFCIEIT